MTTVTKPHQWRSIVTLSAGQITASCSRRGTKICSRCCSIQCALGAECYDCNHLITQDCKPMPASITTTHSGYDLRCPFLPFLDLRPPAIAADPHYEAFPKRHANPSL